MTGDNLDIWTDSPVVRDYMSTEIVTFAPTDNCWTVIDTMLKKQLFGCPVLVDGELVGMVSDKDLLKMMAKASPLGLPKKRVSEVMSDPVVTIPPEMNVFTAASLFRHNIYRRLPVVEDGVLVGLISRSDLLRAMKDIGRL